MKLALAGGFLGSGKTTAIITACRQLLAQRRRVGVVTNDQGDQQVDRAFVEGFGIPVREVTNGCFCCNYNQLDAHFQSLRMDERPEIIFAESVGSCTDLIATIVKPLSGLRPEIETSVSVFTDAELLLSLMEGKSSFLEDSVRYIYKKQLEEADILLLNKIDLLTPEQAARLDVAVGSEYPGKIILRQNSLDARDVLQWLEKVYQVTQRTRTSLNIDYDTYGEGESRLAWLDRSIVIQSVRGDAVFITRRIIGAIFDAIQARQLTIGHLKFFLETDAWQDKISFTTTSTSKDVDFRRKESGRIRVLINARVQTEPQTLENLIDGVLSGAEASYDCTIEQEKMSVFKPGYPRPTYRMQ